MKICIHCLETKAIVEFARRGEGYRGACKRCHTNQKLAWGRSNAPKVRAATLKHYENKLKRLGKKRRVRVPSAPEERVAYLKARRLRHYLDNRETYLERERLRRLNDPEKVNRAIRLARQKKPHLKKEADRRWREANPLRVNFHSVARMLRKRRAMPRWLSDDQKEQMIRFYDRARGLTAETGIKHEVDHIYPLKGKNSCGLHVPWNLQVLTQIENRSKGNRYSTSIEMAA